jgi:Ca2+-binding RTX toxin-like protein
MGGSGGVIAWSVAGAGLTNQTFDSGFFSGTTVAMSSFLPFDYEAVLRQAFDAWAAVANIEFIQVADQGGNFGATSTPMIRIGGAFIDGQSGSNILAQAYYPSTSGSGGDLVFDSSNTTFFSNSNNFFLTALHEIGHTLGLDHEDVNLAIMNPFVNTALTGLQADDVNGIQFMYGAQDFGANNFYMPAAMTTLTLVDDAPSNTINGNASANTIVGNSQANSLVGNGGNDTLTGGGGADSLDGGANDDWLYVDSLDVSIQGGSGYDRMIVQGAGGVSINLATAGLEAAYGSSGNDIFNGVSTSTGIFLDGGVGSDALTGGTGGDVLIGGSNGDQLNGGNGDDWLYVDNLDTLIEGGVGYDRMFVQGSGAMVLDLTAHGIEFAWGGTGNDVFNGAGTSSSVSQYLRGDLGNDILIAAGGNDNLVGDAGSDELYGLAGNDGLYAGIDTGPGEQNLLVGGAGTDWNYGSAGTDTFRMFGAWDVEYIYSFQQGLDKLNFQVAGVTSFGSLGYTYDGLNTIMYYAGNIAVIFGVQIQSSDVTIG